MQPETRQTAYPNAIMADGICFIRLMPCNRPEGTSPSKPSDAQCLFADARAASLLFLALFGFENPIGFFLIGAQKRGSPQGRPKPLQSLPQVIGQFAGRVNRDPHQQIARSGSADR